MAGSGRARLGAVGRDKAWLGLAGGWLAPGFESQAPTKARLGPARLGVAGRGRAGQGRGFTGSSNASLTQGITNLKGTKMIDFRIRITGTAPLLMHSSRLSDPLNDATKALKKVTAKRQKTDEDHADIARLEHAGSLYIDPDVGPYLPGENISRALVDGARLTKQGIKVQRGVLIATDTNPLSYRGPRTVAGLWDDANFRHMASVKIGTSRTMRCRPVFREWTTEAEGVLDASLLDLADLQAIATTAGQMIGLGDWRPRFGRFTAVVERVR